MVRWVFEDDEGRKFAITNKLLYMENTVKNDHMYGVEDAEDALA